MSISDWTTPIAAEVSVETGRVIGDTAVTLPFISVCRIFHAPYPATCACSSSTNTPHVREALVVTKRPPEASIVTSSAISLIQVSRTACVAVEIGKSSISAHSVLLEFAVRAIIILSVHAGDICGSNHVGNILSAIVSRLYRYSSSSKYSSR